MAGQTLGIPSKVGIVMPARWWFAKQQQQQQPAEQTPTTPVTPAPSSDEPPPRPAVAGTTLATKPNADEGGGGFSKSRASIRDRADAGTVDNIGDFAKAVLEGPSGPIGAMSFMGRLFAGRLAPGGFPGSTINNSNLDPATNKKMQDAAAAAAASPKAPPPMAAIFKVGEDYLRNKKVKATPVAGPGGGGGGGSSGGAIGSNAGRRGF